MDDRKIILVGRGGAGKNHLAQIFEKRGFKMQVSITTRPKRERETDGKDYSFLTDEEFDKKIEREEIKEWKEFNGWKYGTSWREWRTKDIFIYTPSGIKELSKEDRGNSCVIFLDINREICKQRMIKRKGNADDVERRLQADDKDFDNFKDYDIRIINQNF